MIEFMLEMLLNYWH